MIQEQGLFLAVVYFTWKVEESSIVGEISQCWSLAKKANSKQ
jgi:hypothetical protein